jgi:hypothetical protein
MYISLTQDIWGIVAIKYSEALLITIPHISRVITNQKGQEPIRYTGALLSIRLPVGLTQIIDNRPSAYKLQRSITEHTTKCKTHAHIKHHDLYLLIIKERYP